MKGSVKKRSTILLFAMWLALQAHGQGNGYLFFQNDYAPTRLISANGPLAGPGYWAQALVGLTPDSLESFGVPTEHRGDLLGVIHAESIWVPFANPDPMYGNGSVYLQLVAWDGRVWGTNYGSVPKNQLGHTDTVIVGLDMPPGPGYDPQFTQPARSEERRVGKECRSRWSPYH